MGVGEVDGEDGDEEEEEEEENSEDAGGVSTDAEGVLSGVGVASIDSGRAAKPSLRRVALTLTFSLALDVRRVGFFCGFCDRDEGAYL
jgi:hypothetical protein